MSPYNVFCNYSINTKVLAGYVRHLLGLLDDSKESSFVSLLSQQLEQTLVKCVPFLQR